MNLNDILSSQVGHEIQLEDDAVEGTAVSPDAEEVEPGYCVECGDQKAELHCAACEEDFCKVCSTVIHRVRPVRLGNTMAVQQNSSD